MPRKAENITESGRKLILHMFSVCNKKVTYLHALQIMLHNTAAHKTKRPRNCKA